MSARALTLVGMAVVLSGCPDESTAPPPPADPVLQVSVASATFAAMAGANDPVPLVVQVTNGGGGTLSDIVLRDNYGAGQQYGWLWWSMNVRTAPTTLVLSPKTGSLPAGTYQATVTLSAAGASNGDRVIAITFTVAPATTPMIALSALDHQFNATTGGAAPAATTIAVTNSGAGILDGLGGQIRYWPGSGTSWLTAQLDRTTAPATLTLRATKTGLAPGLHIADVELTSSLAPNSPLRIGVVFWLMLDTGKVIGVSPPEQRFVVAPGGLLPFQETLHVSNLGPGALSGLVGSVTYGTGQPTGWLQATVSHADAPAYLRLRPTTTNLTPGTYTATVVLTSPDASNSPKSVPVTLSVLGPGGTAIALGATTVSLASDAGSTNPATVLVPIANSGSGTLSGLETYVSEPPGQPGGWLKASLSTTTAPSTLTLRAFRGTLPVGTYQADVLIMSPTAGNSPQFLRVTFTVR